MAQSSFGKCSFILYSIIQENNDILERKPSFVRRFRLVFKEKRRPAPHSESICITRISLIFHIWLGCLEETEICVSAVTWGQMPVLWSVQGGREGRDGVWSSVDGVMGVCVQMEFSSSSCARVLKRSTTQCAVRRASGSWSQHSVIVAHKSCMP